jgi:hypothetical protein
MLPATQPTPAAAYLLADNLDAALAAGEDLLKSSLTWHSGNARSADDIAVNRVEERQAVETLRSLEMILVARILRSRERADELLKRDPRLKPLAKLYNAGTAFLQDAVSEIGDPSAQAFETGDGTTAYLRGRGLIAADAPAPAEAEAIALTEEFLVAARIPLGTLMDLAAMFLDTLETHYDLYDETERATLAVLSGTSSAAEATA